MEIFELLNQHKWNIGLILGLLILVGLFIKYYKDKSFLNDLMNNYGSGKDKSSLNDLMNKYGSDKGTDHNYTYYYENLFENNKNNIKSLCEIGLGTNDINIPSNMGINGKPLASLYGWRDYFENAIIYGGDIDEKILKNEDRIITYKIDMTNRDSVRDFWKNINTPVDIMIDDGLHEYEANVTLFENSINKWKYYYIIEDVKNSLLDKWDIKINEWRNKYPEYNIQLIRLEIETRKTDNNLIVIKHN